MKYEYVIPGTENENRQEISIPDYTNTKKGKIKYENGDVLLALGMLLCGFMYIHFIDAGAPGAGTTLFTLVICTISGLYMKVKGLNQNRHSIITLSIMALLAVSFVIFDGTTIKFLGFVALSLLYVYWITVVTGNTVKERLSLYLVADAMNQLAIVPFSNFTCGIGAVKNGAGENKMGKNIFMVIIGIAIAVPLVAIAGHLLADADLAFDYITGKIIESLSLATLFNYALEILIGLPVALYLYGLVFGNAACKNAGTLNSESLDKLHGNLQIMPSTIVYTVLIAINVLYGIFIFAQTTYMFSAFEGMLPMKMTYAEYARTGFFQLCSVASLNAVIMAGANLFVKRSRGGQKGIRILTGILCVSTLLIITTALSKMFMYINYYGLTQLRVYTSIFMVAMFFTFCVILVRQMVKFNGTAVVIGAMAVLLLTCSFANIDGQIAKYNIQHYETGSLAELDTQALEYLSDGAVPYMYELYKTTKDVELKTQLWQAITKRYNFYENVIDASAGFDTLNLQMYKADIIRETIGKENPENFK